MEQAEAERRVGTTLCNKWKLERMLGVGGMAAVYLAVHKIGRRDAIKILHPEIAKSNELRTRFEMEAHVANRFKHPGAVEIRDIDKTEDGVPFLVMELLEGESLAERARRLNGIEQTEMLRLVDELLDVLAAAHEQGIVHRDIKLDNLFVQKDGKLKVLDFGIARLKDGAAAFNMQTRLGATLGTAPYMSPEQVTGRDVDGRSDLFAVGATIFRLVARRRIHEGATEADILAKMATEPAPSLASVAPKAHPGICLVVDRALQFHRDLRYPDARTMQEDVQAVRAGKDPGYARRMAAAVAAAAPGASGSAFTDAPTAAPMPAGSTSEPTRAPGTRSKVPQGPTVAAMPVQALANGAKGPHSALTAAASGPNEPTRVPGRAAPTAIDAPPVSVVVRPPPAAMEPPPSISVRAIVPAAAPVSAAVPASAAQPNDADERAFAPRRPPPREGFLPDSIREHKSMILFGSAFVVLGIVLTLVFASSHNKASGPVIPAPTTQAPPPFDPQPEGPPEGPQQPERRPRPNDNTRPLGNLGQSNSEPANPGQQSPGNQGRGNNNPGGGQRGGGDKGHGHGKKK